MALVVADVREKGAAAKEARAEQYEQLKAAAAERDEALAELERVTQVLEETGEQSKTQSQALEEVVGDMAQVKDLTKRVSLCLEVKPVTPSVVALFALPSWLSSTGMLESRPQIQFRTGLTREKILLALCKIVKRSTFHATFPPQGRGGGGRGRAGLAGSSTRNGSGPA